MSADQVNQALARIEAATARIGAAVTNGEASVAALAQKHEALRLAVAGSLAEIDSLIESAGQ
jgi:hypothetical protein